MKSVIIDRADLSLDIRDKRLYFADMFMPLSQFELLIISSDALLHSSTLLALTKADIAVLCINKRSTHFSLTLPQIAKNGHYKMAQFSATEDRLTHAKWFITQKITLHAQLLEDFDIQPWLTKISECESIEILLGIEGAFANLYFAHYFQTLPKALHKGKRSKLPPLDPVNAMLSFVYTLVHNQLVAQLTIAGYEPSISYLHTPFRSHYALASDFLELYRASINEEVAQWFQTKTLVLEDFSFNKGVYLRYESRKKLWPFIQKLLHEIHGTMQEHIHHFTHMIEHHIEEVA